MPPEKQTPTGGACCRHPAGGVELMGSDSAGETPAGVALRREKARVSRIGVRAANELNLGDVMRRHHARVAGMKLAVEALNLELLVKRVDAVGHDERRALLTLGEEVAHRAVEGARHADCFAFADEQGEGAVNVANGIGYAGKHTPACFVHGHVVDAIERRIEEVNDAVNSVVHKRESGCLIPMSFQDETKARRDLDLWRDASEAHIRSDL